MFHSLKRLSKNIILFDINHTLLTPPHYISSTLYQQLIKYKQFKNTDLGIVSGGTYDKVRRQLYDSFYLFNFIFCENGSHLITPPHSTIYKNELKENPQYSTCLQLMEDSNLFLQNKIPHYSPLQHLQIRDSMIYFHSLPKKIHFPLFRYLDFRKNIYSRVWENPHVSILLSSNSLSIQPSEWNKSQVIPFLLKENYKNIHYFGDHNKPNYHDYPLLSHPLVIPHPIKNPQHTSDILKILFKDSF